MIGKTVEGGPDREEQMSVMEQQNLKLTVFNF